MATLGDTRRWAGTSLFGAVIAIGLAACGSGGNVSKLNGTWVYDAGDQGVGTYVFDNGSYQYKELYKGTYKLKGSTITFKQTHINMGDGWVDSTNEVTALLTGDTTFEIRSVGGTAVYTKQ
ncbi:MAG: hypothetical protein LBD18_05845 [Treponema sp.]|jgi:hypothetical protein|nr:hypothetical protein [Treponema sp.]